MKLIAIFFTAFLLCACCREEERPASVEKGVYLFVAPDCVIANRYAPTIQRLEGAFSPIRFTLVYADPDLSQPEIERHIEEFGLPENYLHDRDHSLIALTGVSRTPEAVVFDGKEIIYRGRIDNRFVDFGKSRPKATQHDLANAVDALIKGIKPEVSQTTVVGCQIPELR
ncbi:MAG: hypothetical protein ACON5H_03855 [Akkermansiaceae bacterium]